MYETRAKGIFRLAEVKPLPGDNVLFTPPSKTAGGSIDEILPRKNELPRPAVANVDLLFVILSAAKPKPDYLLADKLIIYGLYNHIDIVIGINKVDVGALEAEIGAQYAKSGAAVLSFSAKSGQGLEDVRALLKDKFTCLAGQSAVGKSSLLNALSPQLALEIGGLSKKTARGRHTTRHSELIELEELNAVVADTPGFSILDVTDIEPEELRDYYHEFDGINCRFDMCLHDKEPDCGVKESAQNGEINPARYERYITILHELLERRDNRYA